MQVNGAQTVRKPPQDVFDALTSPEILKSCVPGCVEIAGSLEGGFTATVVQKVGPVKATFKGNVTIEDAERGKSLKLIGQGSGGVAGFASGQADVRLDPTEDGGTIVSYDVSATVGGKIARLGGRIIDGFTKKMADQFFEHLSEALAD